MLDYGNKFKMLIRFREHNYSRLTLKNKSNSTAGAVTNRGKSAVDIRCLRNFSITNA